jgi:membrane-associated phospholipid phosphatase
MSIDTKRRIASAFFVVLLILSAWWPSPIVSVNRLCCDAALGIDELSFLGRESPSWDVVFWCLVGLFALALLQNTTSFNSVPEQFRATRLRLHWGLAAATVVAAVIVALIWRYADSPITAWAEAITSDRVEDWIRIANRFGGGMNPVMIIGFFLLAGAAFAESLWIDYSIGMAVAGAAAGLIAQVLKFVVGRTRPELWLGPFHHAHASASSFPSGHTVGAFALAGVLLFNAESRTLRVVAALLAIAVAVSRVIAFRHWTADVVASAAIGFIAAATFSLSRPRAQREGGISGATAVQ